jgi:hypothetical protein
MTRWRPPVCIRWRGSGVVPRIRQVPMLRRLVAGALVASARTGIRPSSERPSGGGGRPASLASYIRMSPEPVLWPREEHTKAKHELLLAFFNKWVSIHSSYFASRPAGGLVRIYDGFAGPGVYAGGEPGSPLIIMRALCSNANLFTRWSRVRYDIHFVEKRTSCRNRGWCYRPGRGGQRPRRESIARAMTAHGEW